MDKHFYKRPELLICTLLVIITIGVYADVCRHQFVNLDDISYVDENPNVRTGLALKNILWAFCTGQESNWHPLTWLSLMLDSQLFGPQSPAGVFLIHNLALHILNSLLLFWLLNRMTGAVWKSGFVAALFALHPIHVESVAWVSERKDVLSTFFGLLAIIFYVGYSKGVILDFRLPILDSKSKIQNPKSKIIYALCLLAYILSLLSKPMLVTLPFVLLLLDYWPLQRIEGVFNKKTLRLVSEKIPFFALAALSSIVTFLVQQSDDAVKSIEEFPFNARIANAAISYTGYIEKMFWPTDLAAFYPHRGVGLPAAKVWIAAGVLVGVTILTLVFARRYRWLAVGWLWYIGTLVPVVGIIQVGVQSMADRYTYISLTGLFIMICWGGEGLSRYLPYRKAVLTVSGVGILAALTVCTCLQIGTWHNNRTLFGQMEKVTADNYLAYCNIGLLLAQEGKYEQAISDFRKALELYPNYPKAQFNLALATAQAGRTEDAIAEYKKALLLNPRDANIYNNLGLIMAQSGRLGEAVQIYYQGLEKARPDAKLLCNLASALFAQGKTDEAIDKLREALKIEPVSQIHTNLGLMLSSKGLFDQAAEQFKKAMELNSSDSRPHYYLGRLFAAQGRTAEAAAELKKALEIDPENVQVRKLLGDIEHAE